MIGTIRKHSAILWWIIIPITIISFVWFMGSAPSRSGRGGATGSLGTIYGHEVTPEAFENARREFFLFYLLNYGQFPDQRAGVTEADIRRESYVRLLIGEKAKALGVRVDDSAAVAAGAEMLRKLGSKGQPMPMEQFVQKFLTPKSLTVGDLQNYLRSDIAVQQTMMALGLPGALVPPQEAAQLYDRENQEISTAAVFFSYSNYLAQVTPTPAAVEDFYTKNLAAYREPARVSVSYVVFELTNYLAAAEKKLGRTNLENNVEAVIRQQGMEAVPGAKTVEEARTKIREYFLRQEEVAQALPVAKDFATTLYAQTNLAAVARQKGVVVHTTAPFANGAVPESLNVPESFVKAAFKLNAEQPFSEMISSADAVYLLALDQQFPSTVPSLESIRSRATDDYRAMTAQGLAQNAGMIFQSNVTAQVAAGKSFAQSAVAAGHPPLLLKPFALNAAEIPEAGEKAEIRSLKEAAFTTPLGKASRFFSTSEGGFVLSPQTLEPIDPAKKAAQMPDFITQVRRGRQNQAFNAWLQSEVTHELRDTPVYAEMTRAVPK